MAMTPSSIMERKPVLLNSLEGHDGSINAALLIPNEDGVISVSNDRTLRVWLKRDSGQYWPSVCHQLTSDGSALDYNSMTGKFFVGLGDGTIQEFLLAEDFNKTTHQRTYLAHKKRVTDIIYCNTLEWVMSCGTDKYFQWHCTESGRRLGSQHLGSNIQCLMFDEASRIAFVGDTAGVITLLKLSQNEWEWTKELKGHSDTVTCLSWDVQSEMLFSTSEDQSIVCWDIAGGKGVAYELNGHKSSVECSVYSGRYKKLFTSAKDGTLRVWDMSAERKETPPWEDSDVCQKCSKPFFWNLSQMWEDKTRGYRQHHCRRCGKALCDACSKVNKSCAIIGFEYPVRMCDDCSHEMQPNEQVPLSTLHELKSRPVYMDIDLLKKKLLVVGSDRIIRIWDVASLLS